MCFPHQYYRRYVGRLLLAVGYLVVACGAGCVGGPQPQPPHAPDEAKNTCIDGGIEEDADDSDGQCEADDGATDDEDR